METPDKPGLRTRSITAKVTEEEYASLQEFAGGKGQSMGELARDLLLAAMAGSSPDEVILAEILALRTLYLNTMQVCGQGRELTSDDLRSLIARVDGEKQRRARERLAGQATTK